MNPTAADQSSARLSRRRLLGYAGVGLAGAFAGVDAGVAGATLLSSGRRTATPPDAAGRTTVPFHGPHQAGVATPAPARAVFVGFDVLSSTDAQAAQRLLRLWTADAAAMTSGHPTLADAAPELAVQPASLTVTVGIGPRFFDVAGLTLQPPTGFASLPAFAVDQLEPRWSGGDLLLQVCADDSLVVSHAVRSLVVDARPFATVRWQQTGFLPHAGVAPGATPRNLMGQFDGTVNPSPGQDLDAVVWSRDGWFAGGTTMVLRRIRMDLDAWDTLSRPAQERVVGRRLSDGSPLTGEREGDIPDLMATDNAGRPIIPADAHVRAAAASSNGGKRILRRSYSYDDGVDSTGRADAGLLFVSYQANLAEQFVPIQRRLAAEDALNRWTTPVGSAVFAVPPGCAPGGWLGETLFG